MLRAASLLVWLAYLVIPIEGWGLFHGRPLDLLSTATLCAACWLALAGRQPSPARVALLLVAVAAKLTLGSAALIPRGFSARYYANPTFDGAPEKSAEPAPPSFTRIDRRLRFGFDDGPDVPLAFFNDERRFNFYKADEPDRATLPFSVTWQGLWRIDRAGPQTLFLDAAGGKARLAVGDTWKVSVDQSRWTGTVTMPSGDHRIVLSWAVPPGAVRRIAAGVVVNGREQPFDDGSDGGSIARRRTGGLANAADAVVRWTSTAFDALLIVWLLVDLVGAIGAHYTALRLAFDARAALSLVWLLGLLDALVAALPAFGRTTILSGGNDWLTYETNARDIVLHGLLMTYGAGLGQGAPFFHQPLYPYFLAATHWLMGDGLTGALFFQRLFAIATVVALWRTVARIVDERAGLATFVVALLVVYEKFAPWTPIFLSEVLFVPLVCWWMYQLTRFALEPSRRSALAAGIVGGLATLTRSSLLLGWLGVIPALVIAVGVRRGRSKLLALFIASLIAVTATATVRNWIVAHRFVAVSSEGATVLFVGNSSPTVTIPTDHRTTYERLGLDPLVQRVVEYARQQPAAFSRGLWDKARYTLGFYDAIRPGAGTATLYVVIWIAALAGIVAVRRLVAPGRRAVVLIPLLVALSHFAAVVLFQPHVYVDRLLMPLYMLLVPYAAIPLALAFGRADLAARQRTAAAVWIGLAALFVIRAMNVAPWIDVDAAAIVAIAGGLALVRLPEVRRLRAAIYGAYAIVLATWLVRDPQIAHAVYARAEWLFLGLALFSEALMPSRSTSDTRSAATRWLSYAAGIAIGLIVLYALSAPRNADFAWLSGRMAAFGVIGSALYSAIWVEGLWVNQGSAMRAAAAGGVFACFVAVLSGIELAVGSGALLFLAGLLLGVTPRRTGAAFP